MANNNDGQIVLGLDIPKTVNQINSDIKKLQNQLEQVKATGALDTSTTVKQINAQIASLQSQLKNIELKANINTGNIANQSQQVGQQIGNNIAQGVQAGVAKATTAMKSFSKLTDSMKSQNILFNNEGLQDTKLTLDAIKRTYSEFGQVKITNQTFNLDELQSFKVNIEQVNGELKETRSFMMSLSGDKTSFVLPDDVIKGTEKYVQHLNTAKNVINATGEEANALKQKLAEQEKYYGNIKKEVNTLYSLKTKLLSADQLETTELERQIKSTKQRITYNNQQIDKKGLRDNSLTREVNDLEVAKQKQLALAEARSQDSANAKSQAQSQKELNAALKEQQLLASQANKIQLSYANGDYEAKVESTIAKTQQWVNANGEARISTTSLSTALSNLDKAYLAITADGGNTVANQKALKQAESELSAEIKKVTNDATKMNATMAKSSAVDALRQKYQMFYDTNTSAHRKWGKSLLSAISELSPGAEVSKQRIKELEQGLINTANAARQAGKLGLSFFDTIKQGMQKFSYWTSSTFLVMKTIQEVRQVITNVKELDDSMMDLTMATGYNKNQVEELMDTYFKLGEELSATATDVAASADTWLRQGKSIAETNELIKDSMILSKISGLSAEESTKYLTSAMKGYKVATEDVLSVVDKLSAVDMASATDVGGLAEGMSEVAASADLAGVSMDKLLGYLAVVGETTQSGMSEVGTSFNAIFARMGNIKLSRLKDYQNNGEDLSNVETVLRGEGIVLRDSVNEFRNFGEVLDEVAGRWESFSEVSQRAIASAFAGTHHMNEFIILMENYSKAVEYSEISMESSGQAMEKFSAYEDTITAHTEKFKNAYQEMAKELLDSSVAKAFVDLGTGAAKFVKELGLLDTIGLGAGLLAGIKNVGVAQLY